MDGIVCREEKKRGSSSKGTGGTERCEDNNKIVEGRIRSTKDSREGAPGPEVSFA